MTPTSGTAPASSRTDNLALIFQEVLTAIVRLRSNRQEISDAESFRYFMREAIRTAVQEARNQGGYSAEDIKMATLALVGFLDESVLNTRDPMFAAWPRKPLQEELFGVHMAGELVFRNIDELLNRADSTDLADLLEVHYLCLLLGYSGRYSMGGRSELQAITHAIADRIRRIRGNSSDPFLELPSEKEVVRAGKDPWLKWLVIAAAGCLALAVVLFATFRITLASAASELRSAAIQAKK
jgi:type VI secretion system protein ImpK